MGGFQVAEDAEKPALVVEVVVVDSSGLAQTGPRKKEILTCPPLHGAGRPTRSSRLALVAATKQALSNALGLLGVESPESM